MKVKKINRLENLWIDLQSSVPVMTSAGVKLCSRVFFNGKRDIYLLTMSDGASYKFTSNHRLLNSENEWAEVSNIEIGTVFNNGIYVVNKSYHGQDIVLDMEVPDVHHYILENGVISHNSSFLLGQVSPSIEPENSCYYVKKLAKGSFTCKNKFLQKLLASKDKDTSDVWKSILVHGGSVQHLDFLSEHEKNVFKTFGEISQKEIIIQAAQRQKYIDQSQSLNLMVPHNTKPKEVSELLIDGWQLGIKTYYYQRSTSPVQELNRSISTCVSCES